jgi:cytochrome c-type biogenesis protein CcmH/NrfG
MPAKLTEGALPDGAGEAEQPTVTAPAAARMGPVTVVWVCVALCVARVLWTQWPMQTFSVDAADLQRDDQPAQAAAQAREALSREPLDGRAYRLLAQLKPNAQGRPDLALLALALRYAPSDGGQPEERGRISRWQREVIRIFYRADDERDPRESESGSRE